MFDFEEKIENAFSPYHYIEFSNKEANIGLSSQPQRLLLIDSIEESKVNAASSDKPPTSFPPNKVLNLVKVSEDNLPLPLRLKESIDATKAAAPNAETFILLLDKKFNLAEVLPEIQFTQIALLVDDEKILTSIRSELENRWGQRIQLDGHLFFAAKKPDTELIALAKKLNDIHVTVLPCPETEKPHIWSAAFAATNAVFAISPSRPYQTLKIKGISYTGEGAKLAQRNALLAAGVSTWKVIGDSVQIDRLVTTYTKGPTGEADPSYRDLNTKQTLSYIRFDFRNAIAAAYPRHMLAKDNYPYKGAVVTPNDAKIFAIGRYRIWQEANLVQDPDGDFNKKIQVLVDEKEPGKLNFYLPIYLMGQWNVTQTQISFRI